MISVSFRYDKRDIETIVSRNIVDDKLIEYTVQINDKQFAGELGNVVILKEEHNIISFKESNSKTQSREAIDFLASFKDALDWLQIKQPNIW